MTFKNLNRHGLTLIGLIFILLTSLLSLGIHVDHLLGDHTCYSDSFMDGHISYWRVGGFEFIKSTNTFVYDCLWLRSLGHGLAYVHRMCRATRGSYKKPTSLQGGSRMMHEGGSKFSVSWSLRMDASRSRTYSRFNGEADNPYEGIWASTQS